MKKSFLVLVAAAAIVVSCNNDSKSTVEKADSSNEEKREMAPAQVVDEESSSFMVDAANGGMAEVALSKLAVEKSTNAKVKEFASMMVNDHTGVNGEVKALAAKKNVTLPAAITQDKKDKADDLSKKTGKDFDNSYMDIMVKDHEKTVALFDKASKNVKDTEVKNLIDMTLPKIESHLSMAKSIKDGLK